MAGRIRSIKPELLDDEQCAGLSDEAWRLWVSSWLLADDAGNCRAGDRYLASLVWQDSTRSPRVAAILRELRRAGRIEVYTNGTERYLHVHNWEKHQRIDNAGKPRVPGPEDVNSRTWEESRGESPRVSASLGDSPLDQRPPTNDHRSPNPPPCGGAESGNAASSPNGERSGTGQGFDFEAVYALYPRKVGRKKGLQRCRSLITSRSKYDALVGAVKSYAASVAGKDAEYVKHFDTFMGCWEDYAGLPADASPAWDSSSNLRLPTWLPDESDGVINPLVLEEEVA